MYKIGQQFYLHIHVKYGPHCTDLHEARQSLDNTTCKVSIPNFTNNFHEFTALASYRLGR